MGAINDRIKQVLKSKGVSQTELAKKLGVSHATVSERLNKEQDIDSFEFLMAVSEFTGKSPYWLYHGTDDTGYKYPSVEDAEVHDAMVLNEINENAKNLSSIENQYLKGSVIRPITVTVDNTGKELIVYVPAKAQAGYTVGFGDPKYIEKLQSFNIPGFNKGGTYRMFDIVGDSMMRLGGGGLSDGSKFIGLYVEDIFTIRDNMVYGIVTTNGFVVKRVINRLSTPDKALFLKSDNKSGQFKTYPVRANEILEVWEYKGHFSYDATFPTDLWDIINDMQVQQALLSERVDKMDSATRALLNQKK